MKSYGPNEKILFIHHVPDHKTMEKIILDKLNKDSKIIKKAGREYYKCKDHKYIINLIINEIYKNL